MQYDLLDLKKYRKKAFRKTIYLFKKKTFTFLKKELHKKYCDRYKSCKMFLRLTTKNKLAAISDIKVVVYTALYGNYDSIRKINHKNKQFDYFVFTNQNIDANSGWVKKSYTFPNTIKTNTQKNRFLKLHPHLLFPNHDISIYIDSNIQINHDLLFLIGRLNEKQWGGFYYNLRVGLTCTYQEGAEVIRCGHASSIDVTRQLSKYRSEGFPTKYGLTGNSIIVRKHNNPFCVKVMDEWWIELSKKGNVFRDQLCFMYTLWKNQYTIADICWLGESLFDDPLFSYFNHNY